MTMPIHPGRHVRTEIVEPRGLSVTAAASVLAVTRQAMSNLLNEQSDLSPEMALRLEKAFGVRLEDLMEMQLALDIARIRARAGEVEVARYTAPREGVKQPGLFGE